MSLSSADPLADPLADPGATVALTPGLRHAPATLRNREPIRAALATLLPGPGPVRVLELASGTGEHGLWMVRQLPHLVWQPTEADADGCDGIARWRALCPELAGRFLPPALLDAAAPLGPGDPVDAVFAANVTHISPWPTTLGLIAGAAVRLRPGGLLLIYGPFHEEGRATGPGNAAFDADLRRRDPAWGLRDRAALDAAASAAGFAVLPPRMMPADNRLLLYARGNAT